MNQLDIFYYIAYWSGAFLGVVKANELFSKDKRKNILNKITIYGYLFISCIILAFVLSFLRDNRSQQETALIAKQNKHYSDSIQQANTENVRHLVSDNAQIVANKVSEIKDKTAFEVQKSTDSVIKIFVQGLKRGDKNTKIILQNTDTNSNKIAVKIDSVKLKEAYIQLIPEPHNVFKIEMKGNELIPTVWIENAGDRVAYSVRFNAYLVFLINNRFYRIEDAIDNSPPTNLGGQVRRNLSYSIPIGGIGNFNLIDRFYCIVLGEYYIDETLKTKKEIKLATRLDRNSTECHIYDLNIPIDLFLKNAIKL